MRRFLATLFLLMALPATEDFAGGAGALSGNWTQIRTADTVNRNGSGVGVGSINAKDLYVIWTGDQWSNDHASEITVAGGLASGTQFVQLVVRGGQPGDTTYDLYQFYTDGAAGAAHSELSRVVNGTATVLANSGAVAFTTGDRIRLEARGKAIIVYRNGVVVISFTDTNVAALTSGSPGVGVFGNVVTIDNWLGENIPIAGPQLAQAVGNRQYAGILKNVRIGNYVVPFSAVASGPAVYDVTDVEALAAADTQTGLVNFTATRTDSLVAADTETATAVFAVSDTETLSASDSQTGLGLFAASRTESLSAADSETGLVIFASARTESLSAADSEDATVSTGPQTYNVTISESGSAADTQSVAALFAAARTEALAATDSAAVFWLTSGAVTEALSAIASQTGEIAILSSFTFRFAGGPVMSATITAGGVLIASVNGGPVLTSSVSGGLA